jgi:hypothetical protein
MWWHLNGLSLCIAQYLFHVLWIYPKSMSSSSLSCNGVINIIISTVCKHQWWVIIRNKDKNINPTLVGTRREDVGGEWR